MMGKTLHMVGRVLIAGVVCASAVWAQPNLMFVDPPTGEIVSDSLMHIAITPFPPGKPIPDSCALYHSPTPAGNQLSGHASRLNAAAALSKDSTSLIFAFKAGDPEKTGVTAPTGQGPQLPL